MFRKRTEIKMEELVTFSQREHTLMKQSNVNIPDFHSDTRPSPSKHPVPKSISIKHAT